MPRRLRVEFDGAIYHVMTRGNGRQNIVHDDGDRLRLIDDLAWKVGRSDWQLLSFVVLSNHLHLLLKTPRAPRSWHVSVSVGICGLCRSATTACRTRVAGAVSDRDDRGLRSSPTHRPPKRSPWPFSRPKNSAPPLCVITESISTISRAAVIRTWHGLSPLGSADATPRSPGRALRPVLRRQRSQPHPPRRCTTAILTRIRR
jgi:hypothetical protein